MSAGHPGPKDMRQVAADFDLIASALADMPADRGLSRAERAVLSAIPAHARTALDVGCGDGRLARAIALRGVKVTAMDVAPRMVELARARTRPELSIDYRVGDVLQTDERAESYDVVIAVNMVHHAPVALIVRRLASLVAPGGALIIQDVVARPGLRYLPINLLAASSTAWRRLLRLDRVSREIRRLYDQHGRGESYLEPHAVAAVLAPFLPGVEVSHHLGWRYTAVWRHAGMTARSRRVDLAMERHR